MKSNPLAPWAAYTVVGLGALIMLAPFYFMFVFATHSRTEIFSLPPPKIGRASCRERVYSSV